MYIYIYLFACVVAAAAAACHRNPRDVQVPRVIAKLSIPTSFSSQQIHQPNLVVPISPWTSHANGPSSQITWTLPCGGCSPESLFLAALHKKVPKTAVTSVSEWQLRAQNSNYIPQRHDGMSVFPFLSHKQSSARMKSAEFRSSGVNHHISQT
jgi:hypothetical protein